MRINYIKLPTDYVLELKQKGIAGRRKAMAFADYIDDIERGDFNSIRFYANAWNVGKSTAERWIKNFKDEIDLAVAHWELKNNQHYNYEKKQVGQMGHQERDKWDTQEAQANVICEEKAGQMGHQERDKALNKYDDNNARVYERLFDDLFNIYNMNSDFPGSRDKAKDEYIKMCHTVKHIDLVRSTVLYLHDPKRDGKLNNLSNFLKNEVYINYMPKYIRVFTKGVWMQGEYDRDKETFTSTDGEQMKVLAEVFTSKFTKGEIEFIREVAA